MRNKAKKLIIIGLGVAFIALMPVLTPFSYAQSKSLNLLPNTDENIESLLVNRLKKQLRQGTYFLLGIENKLKSSKEELKLLKSNKTALESKIEESKVRIFELNSQISNFDRLIEQNKEHISAASVQIAVLENGIFNLKQDVAQQENNFKKNLKSLDSILVSYYFQNNLLFDTTASNSSLISLLSSSGSIGENLQKNEYMYFLQQESQNLAKEILYSQDEMDGKKEDLLKKKTQLDSLQTYLHREQKSLEETGSAQKRLLAQTKGQQIIYETLLDLSKKEEEQISSEIERLKENYDFFQNKLAEIKNNPDIQNIDVFGNLGLNDESYEDLKGNAVLAWPINPTLGISAYYHDSAYEKALGIRHQGLDIRIAQGSRVKSAGDGIITKVADNGFAYSYVIIAHPDKTLTLYGHLSEMFVTEGEVVREGQTIGLSGGIPGTKGAGWLTTGAHLHLEVFKDFQHVDPLNYLPLELLPIDSIPQKYLEKMTGDDFENKVRRK